LFNSWVFAVFFVVVWSAYWLLRRHLGMQNLLLLAAGYVFYGWWDVRFLLLIVLTTVIDWHTGLTVGRGPMTRSERGRGAGFLIVAAFVCTVIRWPALRLGDWAAVIPGDLTSWRWFLAVGALIVVANLVYPVLAALPEARRNRVFLACTVVANLGILGFFKYWNFFASSLAAMTQACFGFTPSAWTLEVVLPVGISFYTFQTMSYTIDIYRRELKPTSSLMLFATYLSFFPQLMAGPIERAHNLLPQFANLRAWVPGAWRGALWLIAWGLFKKMVVADNLAPLVTAAFAPYDQGATTVPADGLRLLIGLYAFALQIYGDFSGYTDIARGTARLLGFELMVNFARPYLALSPSDFWRRWHISLSTWLRDYLYVPLGGNRGGSWGTYRNLILTMVLGGLWHGASWTFVLWGLFHGVLLAIYRAAGIRPEDGAWRWPARLAMGVLMFHLTCLGWLLFRAQNLATVGVFIEGILLHPVASPATWAGLRDLVFFAWPLVVYEIAAGLTVGEPMQRWPWFVRLNVWLLVVMYLLVFTARQAQEFIYFAF